MSDPTQGGGLARLVVALDDGYASYDQEEAVLAAEGARFALRPCKRDPKRALEAAREADVVLVRESPLPRAVIEGLMKCKAIIRYGIGVDNIDQVAASEHRIMVANVPDLQRVTGLTPRILSCLALFDVLDPADGRYAYRDLVAAREAGRLLARGIELRQVLEAAIALRRRGTHLAETRLAEGPSGELLRELGGQLAELSGQLTMRLDPETRRIHWLAVCTSPSFGSLSAVAVSVGAVSSAVGPRTTWMGAVRSSTGSAASGAEVGSAFRASSTLPYVARPASAASERVRASPTTATSRPSAVAARASRRSATELEVARERPGATSTIRPGSAARTRRTTVVISSSASR